MKTSDILAMIGSFCLCFGAVVVENDVPKWAWWTGKAMIIAGPILMGSRAVASMRKKTANAQDDTAGTKQ